MNRTLFISKLMTLFLLLIFWNSARADEKINKIVYLDIDDENTKDESLFAGLIIEDRIEIPKISFKNTPQPVPTNEINLSPSLRKFITHHERENISGKGTSPK